MALLTVEGMEKHFGGVTAVEGVGFQVEQGEIVGLIGPNGAGKTTVFNCITGYLQPSAGRVTFAGRKVTGLAPHILAREGLVRTFQITQVLTDQTVLENVLLGAFLRHPTLRIARERSLAALDLVGMTHMAGDMVSEIPLSLRKRAEVARCLATEPRLLLLDEAMAGLTQGEMDETLTLLRRLNQETGLTIIVIEHVMRVVMSLSHRILVLHQGRLIADGKPDAVSKDEQVISAYLGGESQPCLR